MKSKFAVILVIAALCIGCRGNKNADTDAAEALAERILGEKASGIEFISDTTHHDTFRLEQNESMVRIVGDNAVSMAVGLNYYLKNYLGVDYGWMKGELSIPEKLVPVTEPIERTAKVGDRFFLNYCTYGYALPWCSWEQWEWLIDWMALNGINMPLALTGQEYIWLDVWQQMGMTSDETRAYFSGPAHLPWHRMGEMDGWQGPLPQSWIDGQMKLQKQILKREREFGMRPVLPAFCGHVPGRIAELYPDANIKKIASWCNFPSPYFLDPNDSLFSRVQKLYLEKQTEVFGTDHYYGADPFNEMVPPSWEPEYLAGVTNRIYSTMAEVDADAKWIEMAWIYINNPKGWSPAAKKACMDSVPKGKLIMLDYQGEYAELWRETESHYGQPFIWCYLGDFGGVDVLEGNIVQVDKMLKSLFEAETTCTGLGCTLEGFSVAPHPFEYFYERLWCDTLDPYEWIRNWSSLRRDAPCTATEEAWEKLIREVFIHPAAYFAGSMMAQHPAFGHHNPQERLPYNNDTLLECCRVLLANPSDRDNSRYDIATLYTQVIANLFTLLSDRYTDAANAGDVSRMKELRDLSAKMFADADALLATREDMLFGRWISNARRFGTDAAEEDYFEENARTLLTRWGCDMCLDDYARRLWQGLVGDYYFHRWQAFFDATIERVENGLPVDGEWYNKEFWPVLVKMAEDVMYSKKPYPADPTGDSFDVARDVDSRIDEYRAVIGSSDCN